MTEPGGKNNMELWDKLKDPPKDATKEITGGRLKGMTDINPQWRLEKLTEVFGPCGIGWTLDVVEQWPEAVGDDGEVIANVKIAFRYKWNGDWSEPIYGIGGNMLGEMEKNGLHVSDEGYKMAFTDAISVVTKQIGLAATVYRGQYDTKYNKPAAPPAGGKAAPPKIPDDPADFVYNFGKHKGKTVGQVGHHYAEWLLNKIYETIASLKKGEGLSARDTVLKEVLSRYLNDNPKEEEHPEPPEGDLEEPDYDELPFD